MHGHLYVARVVQQRGLVMDLGNMLLLGRHGGSGGGRALFPQRTAPAGEEARCHWGPPDGAPEELALHAVCVEGWTGCTKCGLQAHD